MDYKEPLNKELRINMGHAEFTVLAPSRSSLHGNNPDRDMDFIRKSLTKPSTQKQE